MNATDMLILQLADSAFPSGGFAHSAGLEAARQQGRVRGSADLHEFIDAGLTSTSRSSGPLVAAACRQPGQLPGLDQLADAMLSNHVANRASRAQGRAFLLAAERAFSGAPSVDENSIEEDESRSVLSERPLAAGDEMSDEPARWRRSAVRPSLAALRRQLQDEGLPGHLAPVFGASCACLGLSPEHAAGLFVFGALRGVLSAAVRLGIVGPMEAQSIQFEHSRRAASLAAAAADCPIAGIAQTSPMIELLQMNQDRLYSRLFQS